MLYLVRLNYALFCVLGMFQYVWDHLSTFVTIIYLFIISVCIWLQGNKKLLIPLLQVNIFWNHLTTLPLTLFQYPSYNKQNETLIAIVTNKKHCRHTDWSPRDGCEPRDGQSECCGGPG